MNGNAAAMPYGNRQHMIDLLMAMIRAVPLEDKVLMLRLAQGSAQHQQQEATQ